eukprot:Platyproteum_vivax@DN15411_c0_g1_i1.p1
MSIKDTKLTMVHVSVKEEFVKEFIDATLINAATSRSERENLRFDVIQDTTDPTKFILYEMYQTAKGADDHKQTAHYARWRDAVEPMMKEPRRGVPWKVLIA